MKTRQKFLSVLLVLCMALSLIPVAEITSFAEGETRHTVSFNANGHGTAPAPVTVNNGECLWDAAVWDNVALGYEEGYQFYEWSLKPDGGYDDDYDWSEPIYDDIILYAIWLPAIDTVSLTLDEEYLPAAGKTVPDDLKNKFDVGDGQYSIIYAGWIKSPSEWTEVTGTFEDNTSYYLFVNVTPKDGYLFKDLDPTDEEEDMTSVALNGTEVSHYTGHYGAIELWQKFTLGTTETHTVTLKTNGHGTVPETLTVDSGMTLIDAVYGNVDKLLRPTEEGWQFIDWYTDEACLEENEFDIGQAITEDMTLYAKWVKVNIIESVDVTFITPMAGSDTTSLQMAAFSLSGSHYHATVAQCLDDENNNFTGTLEAGKKYYAIIIVYAEDGYVFRGGGTHTVNPDEMVDFNVNGKNMKDTILHGYPENSTGVIYEFMPKEGVNEVINSVSLTVDLPFIGQSAEDNLPSVVLEDDANYVMVDTAWLTKVISEDYGEEYHPFDGVFSEGETYYIGVALMPKERYGFSDTAAVTVNGEVQETTDLAEIGVLTVMYAFTPEECTPVGEVDITVTVPEAGGKINVPQVTLPDSASYIVDEEANYWAVANEDGTLEPISGETFEYEKEYHSIQILKPQNGYVFDENISGTVRGSDGTIGTITYIDDAESPYKGCIEAHLIFTLPDPAIRTKTVITAKTADTVSGRITWYNMPEKFTTIVAGYKDNKLTDIVIENRENFTLSGDIDTVKIFVWDSAAGMTPIVTEPDIEVLK